VIITAENPAQAEVMRIHQDIWVKAIDTSAEAFIPTYPIVVHGVAIKSIHLKEKKKASTIKK
jgi:hypothetical protein